MGKLRSEPDRGNPAVRDRRGACRTVTMGAGLRPSAKVLETPPDPTVYALHFYLDRKSEPGFISFDSLRGRLYLTGKIKLKTGAMHV